MDFIGQLAWTLKTCQGQERQDKTGDYSTLKKTETNKTWQPSIIHNPWLEPEFKTKQKHIKHRKLSHKKHLWTTKKIR